MREKFLPNHLLMAIKTEEEGHEFYCRAAEKASHPLARETFASLAVDEQLHILYLKKVHAQIHQGGCEEEAWEQKVEAEAEAEKKGLQGRMKTIFSRALKRTERQVRPDAELLEIYKMAINFEREGIELYGELAEEESDPQAKKFYAAMQEMEKNHLTLLDSSLQLLEDPGQWFSLQEHWIVAG